MLLALLLASLPVRAGALVVSWDQPVRYHAEAAISTPNGYRFYGWKNAEAVARRSEIALDLSCSGRPVSRGFDVECTLDRVALAGKAFTGDQEDLDAVFAEYVGLMQGQTMQLLIGSDGRVLTVDLEGVDKRDERMARIHEDQRQLLRRALTPLDLGLPKKGDPKSGTWKQKGTPLLFQLMTAYGTAGGSVMKHTLEATEGDQAIISSAGRGNVATGLDIELGAGQTVNMLGFGSARFDMATGQLAWRQLSVTGELTASSVSLGDPTVYALGAWIGRIGADGAVEGAAETP